MGLMTVVSPETAPHLFVFPSMMQASISTVPAFVKTDPLPALKFGLFSSSRTYIGKIRNNAWKWEYKSRTKIAAIQQGSKNLASGVRTHQWSTVAAGF